jgi:hypothetical protein
MPSPKPSAKTYGPGQGQAIGRHGDHQHTYPTPTSPRREAADR